MFRPQIVAVAILAACAFPLAAGAQSAPIPAAPPAAAGQAVPPPAGHARRHHRPDRFIRALARVHLTPDQRKQIVALLTPEQQAQLHAAFTRHRPG